MSIFDHNNVGPPARYSDFSPTTVPEFFALRLAAKLGDSSAAKHYVKLVEQYSTEFLLVAYHRVARRSNNGNLARRFHEAFEPLKHREPQGQGTGGKSPHKLAAIRVDRRAVGVAIFSGDHLVYVQGRQLSYSPGKAIASAVGFIERIVMQSAVLSVVFEAIPNGHERHRKALQESIKSVMMEDGIYPGEVSKEELFQVFAHPGVKSRKQLQAIASRIWPILDEQRGGAWTHDAAMLGLYVQVEAMFENK